MHVSRALTCFFPALLDCEQLIFFSPSVQREAQEERSKGETRASCPFRLTP